MTDLDLDAVSELVTKSVAGRCHGKGDVHRSFLAQIQGLSMGDAMARIALYASLMADGHVMLSMQMGAIDMAIGAAPHITIGLPEDLPLVSSAAKFGAHHGRDLGWNDVAIQFGNVWTMFHKAGYQRRLASGVGRCDASGALPIGTIRAVLACAEAGAIQGNPKQFCEMFLRVATSEGVPQIVAGATPSGIYPSAGHARLSRANDQTLQDIPYFGGAIAKYFDAKGTAGLNDEESLKALHTHAIAAACVPCIYSPISVEDAKGIKKICADEHAAATAGARQEVFFLIIDEPTLRFRPSCMIQAMKSFLDSAGHKLREKPDTQGVVTPFATPMDMAAWFAGEILGGVPHSSLYGTLIKSRITGMLDRVPLYQTSRAAAAFEPTARDFVINPAIRQESKRCVTRVYRAARAAQDWPSCNLIAKVASLPLADLPASDDPTFLSACRNLGAKYGKVGEKASKVMNVCLSAILEADYREDGYLKRADHNSIASILYARVSSALSYAQRDASAEEAELLKIGKGFMDGTDLQPVKRMLLPGAIDESPAAPAAKKVRSTDGAPRETSAV